LFEVVNKQVESLIHEKQDYPDKILHLSKTVLKLSNLLIHFKESYEDLKNATQEKSNMI
jgi:prefoldin subunit 5